MLQTLLVFVVVNIAGVMLQEPGSSQCDPELAIPDIFWDMETNPSYQAIGSERQQNKQSQCGNVNIISRAQWGARDPTSVTPLSTPVQQVYVHHTVTSGCETQEACYAELQSIQNYHMDSLGWNDIGYNFLVGKDGQAYEGRGFDVVGAHTGSCNSLSVAVSMLGNFDVDGGEQPNQAILDAVRNIIGCAVEQGQVVSWESLDMRGHRDACATACPGSYAYAEITTWPWFNPSDPECGC